jgi:deoxycytidine triphosphate deaminase
MFLNPSEIKDLLIDGAKPVSSVVNLAAQQLSKIDQAFSYISNNPAYNMSQGHHVVELSDSMEAHNRYALNRNPARNQEHGWFLDAQRTYVVDTGVSISVPADVTVLILSKPELNDNAVNVIQKVLPAGYTGNISFVLHNINGNTFLEQGTFVAQLFFISSPKVEIVIPETTTTTAAPIVETTTVAPVETTTTTEVPVETTTTVIETTTTETPVVETTTIPVIESAPVESAPVETVAEINANPRRVRPR